jgi:hypothetical protein
MEHVEEAHQRVSAAKPRHHRLLRHSSQDTAIALQVLVINQRASSTATPSIQAAGLMGQMVHKIPVVLPVVPNRLLRFQTVEVNMLARDNEINHQ